MPDPIFARSGLLWETTEGVTVGADLQSAVTELLAAEAAAEAAFAAATNSANAANAAAQAALAATVSGIASINDAATVAAASLTASVTSATTTISTSVATAVSASAASATAAATSASSASGSASAASASAATAATSAGAAAGSASAAASSAASIVTSVTTAAASATASSTSASSAASSASAASAAVSSLSAQQGFRNRLVNGGMTVWQRGTSVTIPASFYTADQWGCYCDGVVNTTVSKVAVTDPTVQAAGLDFALQYLVGGTPSGNTTRQITNRVENPRNFAGKAVRVSFWAKADASRTVTALLATNAGTGGSPAGGANTSLFSASLTTSWQFFTGIATLPAASTITPGTNGDGFLALVLNLPLNTAITITLTGVQMELDTGSATAFEVRQPSLEARMARWFYRTGSGNASAYSPGAAAVNNVPLTFDDMRTSPTVVLTPSGGTNYTSVIAASQTPSSFVMLATGTTAGTSAWAYTYTASAEL